MLRCYVAAVMSLFLGTRLCAAPPKVVQTRPALGAVLVPPQLDAITFTFDQPMSPQAAFTEGADFPTMVADPVWLDESTLQLRVKLEPHKDYWLRVNPGTHQHFKSKAGKPAETFTLHFHTDAPRGKVATPEQIDASIAKLRAVIDRRYSHRDLRRVDWDQRFAEFDKRLRSATSPAQFADAAGNLLKAAEDFHLYVEVLDGAVCRTFTPRVHSNIELDSVRQQVQNIVKHNDRFIWTGSLDGGVGYLLATRFDDSDAVTKKASESILRSSTAANGLVIDLRLNSDTDLDSAANFASRFIDEPVTYARYIERDAESMTGFTAPVDQVLQPSPPNERYRRPVVVLIGNGVMGPAEAFTLMMKKSPRCTIIGETTCGSYSNQLLYTLDCGVRVWVPSHKVLQPDGRPIEAEGVQPDVLVKTTDAQLAQRDVLIDRAMEIIRSGRPESGGR